MRYIENNSAKFARCMQKLRKVAQQIQDVAPQDEIVLSKLGQAFLSCGDYETAEDLFGKAECFSSSDLQPRVNNALLAIHLSNFVQAREEFELALSCFKFQEEDISLTSPVVGGSLWTSVDVEISIVENLAVASLYTKELHKAVQLLEGLLVRDPLRYCVPTVIRSLLSLYQFLTGDVQARRKQLEEICLAFVPEDFDFSVFQSDT